MPEQRDLGLRALQNGDTEAAIRQLEAACARDAGDYQALIYLGAAYSRADRTLDAIQVLTKAVELQPGNPQGRYNLGLAMERGGYQEQAATAYGQAITLQPDYPKAREALQRVQGFPPVPPIPTPENASAQLPGNGAAQNHGNTPSPYAAPSAAPSVSPYGAPYSQTPTAPSSPYGAPYAPPAISGLPNAVAPIAKTGPDAAGVLLGLVLGGIGGVLGTILWVTITRLTHAQIGYAAVGVGAFIGWMTKLGVRQGGPAAGIIAAVISVFSLGLGCLMTGGLDAGSMLFALLFVGIGVSAAYRIAAS